MAEQAAGWMIGLQIEDGDETYWARPGPQDDKRLLELLRRGSAAVTLADEGTDVAGHAQSADVTLDVEGHAVTIRLPSPADAAALRRRLALGAVAATIVAAGAVAALQDAGTTAPASDLPAAPAAPLVQPRFQDPAGDVGLMDQAAQRAAEQLARPQVQQPAAPGIEQAAPRWINGPYMIDKGPPAAPHVGAPAGTGAGGQPSDHGTVPRAGQKPELR